GVSSEVESRTHGVPSGQGWVGVAKLYSLCRCDSWLYWLAHATLRRISAHCQLISVQPTVSGTVGRRFDSCRGHLENIGRPAKSTPGDVAETVAYAIRKFTR